MALLDIVLGIVVLVVIVWIGLGVLGRIAGNEGKALMLVRQAQQDPDEVRSEIDTLTEMLDSENTETREAAVTAMSELAKAYPEDVEASIPRLVELLEDPNDGVRTAAATALVHLAEPYPEETKPATKSLIDMLYANDPETRIVAAGALVEFVEVFVDRDWEAKTESIADALTDSFAHVAPEEYPLLLAGLVDIANAYPTQAAQAERRLAELLEHPDPDIRRDACRILRDVSTAATLEETTRDRLRGLHEDPDTEVQSLAAEVTEQDG